MASIHLTDMHSVHSARRIKEELEEMIEFFQNLDMSANKDKLPKLRAHINRLKALQVVYHNALEEQVAGMKRAAHNKEIDDAKILVTPVDRVKVKKYLS